MADNNRTVQLDVAVGTSGGENIRKLATDVEGLAKSGGDAAPEFSRLAAELTKLAAQADAVQAFSTLSDEVRLLSAAETEAKDKASTLAAELQALAATTRAAAAAEAQARADEKQAGKDTQALADERAKLRIETDAAGKKTSEYKDEYKRLSLAILEGTQAERAAAETRQQAAEATKVAQAAEDALAAQYKQSEGAAQRASAELGKRKSVLDADRAALEADGIATADLAAEQFALIARFNAVSTEAGQLQAQVVNLARAQKDLAEIRAFDKAAEDAKRLVAAGDYVHFWAEALNKAEIAERDLREANGIDQKAAEAQRLAAAADYVRFWTEALDKADLAEKDLREANGIAQKADEAQRLFAAADYVKFWTDSLNKADLAEKELADSKAFDQKAAEAKRLFAAADYVKFWTEQLDKAELAEKSLAEQTARTSAALDNAFKSIGTRSLAALRDEINEVGAALIRLRNNPSVPIEELERASIAAKVRIEALRAEIAKVPGALNETKKSTDLVSEAFRTLTAYYGAFQLGKSFIDANVQLEGLRRTLVVVTGSADTAAKQIEFLRKTANDSGISIGALTQEFSKFVASTTLAGVSLQTSDRLFAAVTKSMGQMGRSGDDVAGSLNALGQMASKGKVSLEELRQQLGDRFPAAMAITAKSLGLTTGELDKLVTGGHVLADTSFFEAYASGVESAMLKGTTEVKGFAAELARLKNTFNEVFVDIGQSGVMSTLASGLRLTGGAVKDLWVGIETLGKVFGTTAGFIATFNKSLLTGDTKAAEAAFTTYGETMKQIATEQGEKLGSLKKAIGDVADGTTTAAAAAKDATPAMQQHGKAVADSASAATQGAAAQTAHGKAVAGTTGAATQGAAAMGALGTATTQAGNAAAASGDQWYRLLVDFGTLIDTVDKQRKALEHMAEATHSAGAASTALANIAGNEIDARNVASAAAEKNALALGKVALARETEARLLAVEIDRLEADSRAHGTLSEARQKELTAMRLTLDTKNAEAQKSREAATQAEVEATAKRVLVQTYGDQSAQLDKLRKAYTDAQAAQTAAVGLEQAGLGTANASAAATRALAEAEARYHDALNDTTDALKRKSDRVAIDLSLTQAQLGLEKARVDSDLELARMQGNGALALEALIRQKQLEIKVIEAKVQATKLESAATIASAEANKAALESEGKLTEDKRLAIDSAIASAKVRLLEAQATEAGIKVKLQEIDNLRIYGDAAGAANAARGRSIDLINAETDALSRNAKVTRDIADAKAKQDAVNHTTADNTGIFSLQDKQSKGTLSAADLTTAKAVYDAAKANLQQYQTSPGSYSAEGANSITSSYNSARAIYERVSAMSTQAGGGGGGAPVPPPAAPAPAPSPSPTTPETPVAPAAGGAPSFDFQAGTVSTVHVVLPSGAKTTVNTATPGDAETLRGLVQQLANLQSRSGN